VAEGCADGQDLILAGGPGPARRLPGCSGAWSPDGKTFAWVDLARLHIADGTTLREIRAFDAPGASWVRFAGTTLLLTHDRRTLRFWSARTGECLRELDAGPLSVVALSPDGRRLAAGLQTGEVKVFGVR
ncbi:MAG: PD40 domain-containing protein, partial [Candidatus Brocadiae bacterium]|nr:PD40 domain-containing protein [Candidatus Brocadiia bacterium]